MLILTVYYTTVPFFYVWLQHYTLTVMYRSMTMYFVNEGQVLKF